MLLSELHGYKKFLGSSTSLEHTLLKLSAKVASGAWGIVIVGSKPYVYKIWGNDKSYDLWLKYLESNQSKNFIKLLTKPKPFPLQLRHKPESDTAPSEVTVKLKCVKLEKLEPLADEQHAYFDTFNICMANMPIEDLTVSGLTKAVRNRLGRNISQATECTDFIENNEDFMTVYMKVAKDMAHMQGLHGSPKTLLKTDMHGGNIMRRGHEYVITDPLTDWNGDTEANAALFVGVEAMIEKGGKDV